MPPVSAHPACPLCASPSRSLTAWAWRCSGCGVRFSSLEPHIEAGAPAIPDEEARAVGLRLVRRRGHAIVLDEIARRRPLADARVLDVGSGHGWFLECVAERGAQAIGIEPDRAVAARTQARGLDVRCGFFPDDLPPGEQFDVITFNDVFEHLPGLPAMLAAVSVRLAPDGLLAISIPTADGLAYRTATALARAGLRAPLDRLWQRDLPSPHLWYFTERSLTGLVTSNGFRLLASGRLPSVERAGLRERISADPRAGAVARLSSHAIALAVPVLNHPRCSDAMWLLFAKAA